jgi:hypothetical protein
MVTASVNLSANFAAGVSRGMYVRIAQAVAKDSYKARKISRIYALGWHSEYVGGGPGPANRTAMAGSVGARWPRSAAEKHDDLAV